MLVLCWWEAAEGTDDKEEAATEQNGEVEVTVFYDDLFIQTSEISCGLNKCITAGGTL